MSIKNFFKADTTGHQALKKEEFLFFYGSNEVFSQFHKVDFEVKGEQYCCMEQYMHYQKAVTFNDRKTAKAIMETTEPRMHKKLGRKVTPFDPFVWARKSCEVVKEGNIAKFSQNDNLREIMFSTYPKTLVEASPRDKLWGIGMGRNNPDATNRSKWKGKNLLGETLTEVRAILMKKFDIDPEKAAKQPQLDIYIDPKKIKKRTTEKNAKEDESPKKNHTKVENSKVNLQKDIVASSKEKVDAPNEKSEVTPKKDKPTSSGKSSSSKKKTEASQSNEKSEVTPKKDKPTSSGKSSSSKKKTEASQSNEKSEVTPKKDKPTSSGKSSSTKRKKETTQSEDGVSPKKRKLHFN